MLGRSTNCSHELAGVVSDINYLSSYGEHYRTAEGSYYSLFDDQKEQKQALTRLLHVFSREKRIYDQIRFLSTGGTELIRINFNHGEPYAVATRNLQEKSSRYYFQALSKLNKDDLYISPLDLNIEQGEIELPYKPVLRFGKPVFNAQGTHRGYLLLNFLGSGLLQAFSDATKSTQAQVMLLNQDGYWLNSPDKSREWGFMFGNRDNINAALPLAWKTITQNTEGQFYTDNNLVSYSSVSPLPAWLQTASTPNWKVVSLVAQSHPALAGTFESYATLYGSMLVLLAFGSWLLANTINRNRQSEIQVAFEQRFRRVLEHVDLLALSVDKQGEIIFCNEALAQLTGWSREQMLGRNWFDTCVADEYKSTAQKLMLNVNSGKGIDTHEDALIKTRAGNICHIEWNHTLIKDADGIVHGLTCIGENVTEIRSQEQQLLTLSRAVEQSPVVVMIVDTDDGGIQYVNPQFTEVTGYSLNEVQGKNPSMLRSEPQADIDKYRKLWKAIEAGKTWHGIFKNKKKNGEIYWASASISSIRDNDGNIVNYIGVQEDITERLNLEQKFRMSVEGSPYAMVMIDAEGKIILINSRTEEYFGYSSNELMGQTIEMLIPDEYHNTHDILRNQFITTNPAGVNRDHGIGRNLCAKHKDGSIFPVEIALNLIDSDDGKITLASIIDITQRRELESKLDQRNREITRSKTLAIVGRMATMVAHDLRNPLSSIKMSLQILNKPVNKGTEEQSRELKNIALQQVSHMESNLDDMLDYAHPAALKPQWLDIDSVLNETINMLQAVIQNNKAIIDTDIQPGLPTVYVDPGKLRLVFSNLISNAVYAATESGNQPEITILAISRLGDNAPAIQIEISDNGPGINEEQVEHLFEPFYTTRSTGSGLGLAIAKGIIDQHKGQIILSSHPGGAGTLCTVILPVSTLITQETQPEPTEPGEQQAL